MGFCHNLLLPSEGCEALAPGAEHKLTNIFHLAYVRNGHRHVAEGHRNCDKAVRMEEDSDL